MALNRTGKLIALAALAAALLGVLVVSVKENRTIVVEAKPTNAPTAAPNTPTSGTVVGTLQAPRYTGRTANGTTWNLSAESAEQRGYTSATPQDKPKTTTAELSLINLTASLIKPNESPLTLHSKSALYTQNTTQLNLPEGVEAEGTLGGYHVLISAPQATAELSATTLGLRGGVSATLWPR